MSQYLSVASWDLALGLAADGDSSRHQHHYVRVYTPLDGACFYHSICLALSTKLCLHAHYTDEVRSEKGLNLRQMICEHTPTYKKAMLRVDETLRQYIPTQAQLLKPGFFAGDFMWHLAAERLQFGILFLGLTRADNQSITALPYDIKDAVERIKQKHKHMLHGTDLYKATLHLLPERFLLIAIVGDAQNHFQPILMYDSRRQACFGVFDKSSMVVKKFINL